MRPGVDFPELVNMPWSWISKAMPILDPVIISSEDQLRPSRSYCVNSMWMWSGFWNLREAKDQILFVCVFVCFCIFLSRKRNRRWDTGVTEAKDQILFVCVFVCFCIFLSWKRNRRWDTGVPALVISITSYWLARAWHVHHDLVTPWIDSKRPYT